MRVGVFADAHDHIDNVRRAVVAFNQLKCELVLFAGDFVSPLVVPPLRKLHCPLIACFGDNDGNIVGIRGGMKIVGTLGYPPFGIQLSDGTKILMGHELGTLRPHLEGVDVVVFAHSHKPSVVTDARGRLFLNPGETSGWVFRKPTIAYFDSDVQEGVIVSLPELGPAPVVESF